MNRILLFLPLFFLACSHDEQMKPSPAQNDAKDTPAIFNSKVQSVLGTVTWQKMKATTWDKLRVGQKVVENDRVRTELESETVLLLSDASALSICENTDVTLKADLLKDKSDRKTIEVNQGRIGFDIQKQNGTRFEFKTNTVIAAIRGTNGFFGKVGNLTVLSLKEGRVNLRPVSGSEADVVENQTAILNSKGEIKVLPLISSGTGALFSALDSLRKSGAQESALDADLKIFDEKYAGALMTFKNKVSILTSKIADTLYAPSVMLQARVTPGVIVSVLGESDTVPLNGIYDRTFTWDASAYGLKRFMATCGDGRVEFVCAVWNAVYAEPRRTIVDSAAVVAQNTEKKESGKIQLSLDISGAADERVHLDPPQTEYSTELNVKLNGISPADLSQIKSIEVRRKGIPVATVSGKNLNSLVYGFPVKIERNRIAEFEVVATLGNGKKIKRKKTYEVFCLLSNHPGGKARNSILSQDEEYERLKQSGALVAE